MSEATVRTPLRCFCSALAKRTNDDVFVCGYYKSRPSVCLFHLHLENLAVFYEPDRHSMPLGCDMCLATIKIHSRQLIIPCDVPAVQCGCNAVATFYQSKQENVYNNMYFFGCPNWKTARNCKLFVWAHSYKTKRDLEVLARLLAPARISQQSQLCKRAYEEETVDKVPAELECVVCHTEPKAYMISPCNHLCCCVTCIKRIEKQCPMCRGEIQSTTRVYLC